jgi:hypothetical protein
MNYYIKYAQYFYLIVAILFIADAFSKFQNNEVYWISLLLAGIGIFMFIFKRNFAKKFESRNKK